MGFGSPLGSMGKPRQGDTHQDQTLLGLRQAVSSKVGQDTKAMAVVDVPGAVSHGSHPHSVTLIHSLVYAPSQCPQCVPLAHGPTPCSPVWIPECNSLARCTPANVPCSVCPNGCPQAAAPGARTPRPVLSIHPHPPNRARVPWGAG